MDGNGQPQSQNDYTTGQWQFRPENATLQTAVQPQAEQPVPMNVYSVSSPPTGPDGGISWTAGEFISHHKSSSWYGALALVAAIGAFFVWLLTKDIVSAVFIIIAAAGFGVIAGRQPREQMYRVDAGGIQIGPHQYHFDTFRSFSVMREGAFSSISFMPLKRFGQVKTIYYDPNDEQKIVALLTGRLPQEQRQHDAVDRLMWRIRF